LTLILPLPVEKRFLGACEQTRIVEYQAVISMPLSAYSLCHVNLEHDYNRLQNGASQNTAHKQSVLNY